MAAGASPKSVMSKLRLLRYALPYWRGWSVIVGTMLAGVGMNVLKPWPTALLVDNVLGNKPIAPNVTRALAWLPASAGREGLLLWVTIGTVIIFLIGWVVGTINGWVMLGIGQRMTYDVGADLFLHLQKLSLLFHSRRSVADSINRVNGDTYCVQTLITGVIMPFVQSVVTLLAMFGIMWRLDHRLTLLSLVTVPFMMLAVKFFSQSMWQRTHERRELEGRMMGIIHQALSA
ncbi:MAG TPA: ABC transporter transmembrane domain-containing protein, partial [Tepidisphaeraceae bacterium]|nr:ABC transporter transmembrane domain-containing protein [Tepidisphaeraceae bacterium]